MSARRMLSIAPREDGSRFELPIVTVTRSMPGPFLDIPVRRAPSAQPGERVARVFTDFAGREVP